MMDFKYTEEKYPGLEELIAFHGHLCPGLALGYRATLAGLERLDVMRARDEELIAIVENDSCSVDAAQLLAGTTFGKGNLIFRDFGKQVFTFARRDDNRAVRVSRKPDAFPPPPEPASDWRQEKIDYILNAPLEALFDVQDVEIELPPAAEIRQSVICEKCGEPVMETRTVQRNGKTYCLDCLGVL
jgi:formylmethanofuran dehydrogenase subunit E